MIASAKLERPHLKATQWKPGQSGNPAGRKPGVPSGRQMVLMLIDKLLSEEKTKAAIEKKLREIIESDPLAFLNQYGIPFIPKEMVTKGLQEDGSVASSFKISFTVAGPTASKKVTRH